MYSDTVGASESGEFRSPARQREGNDQLPSPREVSTAVHGDSEADAKMFTMMVMQWGQFTDHDITSTPQSRGFNDSLIKCCSEDGSSFLPESIRHPDCRPIEIPSDDPFYRQHNVRCMEFVRSSAAASRDCSLGPRDQMNQITSFIDASNIYGSTDEDTRALRLFEHGRYAIGRFFAMPALNFNSFR